MCCAPVTDETEGLIIKARISDFAVVPYRQDQSPRLDFWVLPGLAWVEVEPSAVKIDRRREV